MRGSGPASAVGLRFGERVQFGGQQFGAFGGEVGFEAAGAVGAAVQVDAAGLVAVTLLVVLTVLIQAVDQLPGVAVQHGRVQVPAVLRPGWLEPVAGLLGDLVGQRIDAAHDHGGVPLRQDALSLRGSDEREPRLHRLPVIVRREPSASAA